MKPCPFCNGEDTVVTKKESIHKGGKNTTFEVICVSCNARGPEFVKSVFEDEDEDLAMRVGLENAEKLWNIRYITSNEKKKTEEDWDDSMSETIEEISEEMEKVGDAIVDVVKEVSSNLKDIFSKKNKNKIKKTLKDMLEEM